MGGNAFELAERLTAEEYHDFVREFTAKITPGAYCALSWHVPPSVAEKESYGDVDVLTAYVTDVLVKIYNSYSVAELINHPNGNNILLNWRDKLIQVDLNFCKEEDLEFARNYFSYNDMGNLVGRIAYRQGLKFGHDGLWFLYRDGSRLLGEILLTKDFGEALSYLGFDVEKYHEGFETFDEMFSWIENSKFFEPSAFPLEHRNHAARMRDSKRKTYQDFLKRINFDGEYVERDLPAWLVVHLQNWPNLIEEIEKIDADLKRSRYIREKLNGNIVSELTGCVGKDLGEVLKIVHNLLPRDDVYHLREETIHLGIMYAYNRWRDGLDV